MSLMSKLRDVANTLTQQASQVEDPAVAQAVSGLANAIRGTTVQELRQVGDSYGWGRPCSIKSAACTGEKTSGLFTIISETAQPQINICQGCFDHNVQAKKWVRAAG